MRDINTIEGAKDAVLRYVPDDVRGPCAADLAVDNLTDAAYRAGLEAAVEVCNLERSQWASRTVHIALEFARDKIRDLPDMPQVTQTKNPKGE
jgi:hypothetical protein